jgi:ADP-ribosylglycohydrolase
VNISRKQKTISSSLWAAYGDILGFPTELASASMVRQRLGNPNSTRSTAWRRLVGGRFGAQVDLCPGAYSDDTQLRLATSRSIGPDGFFDVESFAKVELPIWLSYSLGAGRGSKAAANSLSDRSSNWFSNFYAANGLEYVHGGGNGAAMRIQPHVWAAQNLADERTILASVIRNAISTHGHIRGIAGAMVHAIALARIFRHEKFPSPNEWSDFADVIRTIPELVSADSELSAFWLPTWEKLSGIEIGVATARVADEWVACANDASRHLTGNSIDAYTRVVKELGGLTDAERGSGLKSALFSLAACWVFRDAGPKKCIETIANYLESDTDTIGTMAGALPNQISPDDTIQDRDYLEAEAIRLFEVSQGTSLADRFPYPDLLYWQPPKTALDCVGSSSGNYELTGFGGLSVLSEEFVAAQKGTVWQWFQLDFGQTIVCKRRSSPKSLSTTNSKVTASMQMKANESRSTMDERAKPASPLHGNDLFSTTTSPVRHSSGVDKEAPFSLDQLTDSVIRSNFEPGTIGQAMLRICNEENAIELSLAFSAIIVKARRARMRKGL